MWGIQSVVDGGFGWQIWFCALPWRHLIANKMIWPLVLWLCQSEEIWVDLVLPASFSAKRGKHVWGSISETGVEQQELNEQPGQSHQTLPLASNSLHEKSLTHFSKNSPSILSSVILISSWNSMYHKRLNPPLNAVF